MDQKWREGSLNVAAAEPQYMDYGQELKKSMAEDPKRTGQDKPKKPNVA